MSSGPPTTAGRFDAVRLQQLLQSLPIEYPKTGLRIHFASLLNGDANLLRTRLAVPAVKSAVPLKLTNETLANGRIRRCKIQCAFPETYLPPLAHKILNADGGAGKRYPYLRR
jgi:hypothetical protein